MKVVESNCIPGTSVRDGGFHGFYASILEVVFPALLAQFKASAVIYNIYTHFGALLGLISQYFGAQKVLSHKNPKLVIATVYLIQSSLLFALFLILYFGKIDSSAACLLICATSALCIFAGNFIAALWHGIWVQCMPLSARMQCLARRANAMSLASLLTIPVCVFGIRSWDFRAIALLFIFLAASVKFLSACSILLDSSFPVGNLSDDKNCNSISESNDDLYFKFIPFYFSAGLASGYIFPFLNHRFTFSANDFLIFSSLQLAFQVVSVFLLKKLSLNRSGYMISLLISFVLSSFLPLFLIETTSWNTCGSVFALTGMVNGGLAIGVAYMIHSLNSVSKIASAQANFVIVTSLATLMGAFYSTVMLYLGMTFEKLFYLSFVCRMLSLYPILIELLKNHRLRNYDCIIVSLDSISVKAVVGSTIVALKNGRIKFFQLISH